MLDTRGLVLGELAVRERLITAEQLDRAIAEQEKLGDARPLGSVMVHLGMLAPAQVNALLERQKELLEQYERSILVSGLFGRIAVQKGFLTEAQLATALRTQLRLRSEGREAKIGHIMLASGILTMSQFWEIIREQGDFRCGHCGKDLQSPRFEKTAIVCEWCGQPAATLQAF